MDIYLGQMYPLPIDHRCMEYHYTKISFTYSRMHIYQGHHLQLTIDLWNATTLNKFNI